MKSKLIFAGVAFVLVVFLFIGLFGFGVSVPMSTPHTVVNDTDGGKTGETAFNVSSSRYLTEAVASSYLPYDLSARLAYGPAFALDENWNTAWCTDEELPSLTLTFDETTELGNVGLVGGYAASEELYFENDRIKSLALSYNGSEQVDGVDEVLTFEDRYGMQFFELNVKDIDSVHLQVLEVYPGSKYSDLCLAEVDFWSDFVTEMDAEAAADLGHNEWNPTQTCEDGSSYPDESTAEELREGASLVYPTETDENGSDYLISAWNLAFTVPSEYADFRVFYIKNDYAEGLQFWPTLDPACFPYGDMMGIYLALRDFEEDMTEESASYLEKAPFSMGALSGNSYREEWFGGDILTYAFDFKNTTYAAGSLACPLDEPDCGELEQEGLLKSVLSTLH